MSVQAGIGPQTDDARPGVPNRYVVCHRRGRITDWGPPFDAADLPPECDYYGKILAEVERALPDSGLVVYLTWNTRWLPSYGPDVVAFCVGDEWSQWPTYTRRVAAVFKTMGYVPSARGLLTWRPRHLVSNVVAYTRVQVLGARTRPAQLRWALTPRRRRGHIDVIPLGTFKLDLTRPVPAWQDRTLDVTFQGSIVHGANHTRGVRRFVPSPKTFAREAMLRQLEALRETAPDLAVHVGTMASFLESEAADGAAYTALMGDTRVCLAPRGTNIETYRAFEGMALGCLVVSDKLPRHWFYGDGIIEVDTWADLPAVLDRYLRAPGAQQERQRRLDALARTWQDSCSPPAVARRVIDVLRRPTAPRP